MDHDQMRREAAIMQDIARQLDGILKPAKFALLVFAPIQGEMPGETNVNYIGTLSQDEKIAALKGVLARLEGRGGHKPGRA